MRNFAAMLFISSVAAGFGEEAIVAEVMLPAGEVASVKSPHHWTKAPLARGPLRTVIQPGQTAILEAIREARYPVEFDPAQVVDLSAAVKGKGGVVPQTPHAFETTNAGWSISLEARPGPKLITLVGKATYTAVDIAQAVHGEGAGPILREFTDKRGKKQTELLSPNVGQSAVAQTTSTNFQVYATPGKVYKVPVRRGDKTVELEVVCDRAK
jgi:hypothetical protein